jgi:hypothetical protein
MESAGVKNKMPWYLGLISIVVTATAVSMLFTFRSLALDALLASGPMLPRLAMIHLCLTWVALAVGAIAMFWRGNWSRILLAVAIFSLWMTTSFSPFGSTNYLLLRTVISIALVASLFTRGANTYFEQARRGNPSLPERA